MKQCVRVNDNQIAKKKIAGEWFVVSRPNSVAEIAIEKCLMVELLVSNF